MPAYKDEKKGTWRVTFRYTDWTGKKKQTTKRGFRTKREALQYEAKFLARTKVDMDILLEDFMEIYFRDKEYELKPSSIKNKRHTMVTHVLPYFGKRKILKILRKWNLRFLSILLLLWTETADGRRNV